MATEGWYTRVRIKQTNEIRWFTVNNFWVDIFKNKKDQNPMMSFPLSNVEMIDGKDQDLGVPHAIKLVICRHASIKEMIISTPNKFDIEEIKEKVQKEITNWQEYIKTNDPKTPQTFTMDQTGRFTFRAEDRIPLTLRDQIITLKFLDKEDITILIDESFDTFPTLESENDPKWIFISSSSISLHLHCASIEDMKNYITTALHIIDINKTMIPEENNFDLGE